MANKNNPIGGKPINNLSSSQYSGKTNKYYIPASDSDDIFINDFVKLTNTSNDDGVPIVAKADDTDNIVGIITSVKDILYNQDDIYRKANVARYVDVIDDRWVEIEIQVNGTITNNDIGKYANIVVGSGNTSTGISATQLDLTTLNTGGGQLKILGILEKEGNEWGEYTHIRCVLGDHENISSNIFTRTGTTIEPVNSGDNLDMGTGDITATNAYFTGKLTVDGLIDPTALVLDPQAVAPGTDDALIYYDSGLNRFQFRENGSWISLGDTSIWARAGTTISPETAGDDLDMGTGDVDAANVDVTGNYKIGTDRVLAIDPTDRSQLFVGYEAGINTEIAGDAYRNTAVGHQALLTNVKGSYNSAFGYRSLYTNNNATPTGGNTAVGAYSLWQATGISNTGIGSYVGYNQSGGDYNVLIGTYAGNGGPSGTNAKSNNTMIGYGSGQNTLTGNGNVFLGYLSGSNETGSNKLYIENSNSASPLIYGEFDTNLVKINGTFQSTGNVTIGAGAAGVDYTLTFDGEDNDGVITWLEDEDTFDMSCNFTISTGTLGVNLSEALYSLHVAANSSNLATGLLLDNQTGGASSATGMRFRSSSGELTDIRCKAGIFFERTEAGGVGSLHLAVEGTNDDSNSDLTDAKLTITKDGNVVLPELTTTNGILRTNGSGTISSSITLPDGTLATTQSPSDNSTKLATTAYADAASGVNYWTRTGGDTLEPLTANDNLDMGSGIITTTGQITGGDLNITGTTTTLLGTSIDTTGGNFTVNGTGAINVATDANTNTVSLASGAGTRTVYVGGVNSTLNITGYDVTVNSVDLHFSAIATKGELIACDGTRSRGLIVGSDDEILVADSSTATGLKWAAATILSPFERTGTIISPVTAGDDLDMGSGDITTTGEITGGNLTITSSTPKLHFNDTDDDQYLMITEGDDDFHLYNDVAGANALIKFFTSDGDGTDTIGLHIFGVGTTASQSNQESLKMEYNTGYTLFQIYSSNSGTGTVRDLRLGAGNTGVTSSQLLLATNGRVGMNLNLSTPTAQLHVDQKEDDGAIPVLALDQADVSEGFINFIGSDRGVISSGTSSTESVRVEINGAIRRLALYADA